MLSLNQTFDDSRAIKILVVPIGENSLFDSHFNVVSRLQDMPMYELTRPSTWKTQTQGCKNFNWNTGNLLFEYLRYDRVPSGPGDLDNFQPSRRVLMIMGLINYPELGNADIDKQLSSFARKHQNIALCRVFVFNYSFENSPILKGPSGDPNSLIIFPPDLECEGGSSMVSVHLQEVMSHASVKFLESLNQQMIICEDLRQKQVVSLPQDLVLSTNHDEMEDPPGADGWSGAVAATTGETQTTASGGTDSPAFSSTLSSPPGNRTAPLGSRAAGPFSLGKRRVQERLRKWMGDLCLQSCSPIDALEHFNAAITEARLSPRASPGDRMWLAGALEGFTAAVLLAIKLGFSVEDSLGKELRQYTLLMNSSAAGANGENPASGADSSSTGSSTLSLTPEKDVLSKALRLAEDRANEALTFYSKNIVFFPLEVECCLKLARMHEASNEWNKEQRALEYIMRAAAVPGLNTQQQVECIVEGGLIARRLGLQRKYALLLYIAGLLMTEHDNPSCAHDLIRNACSQYGIQITLAADRGLPYSGANTQSFSVISTMRSARLIDVEREDEEEGRSQDSERFSHFFDTLRDKVLVANPAASWPTMRRSLFAYSAHAAMESCDHQAATRYVAALIRLMMNLEAKNCRYYGWWVNYIQSYISQWKDARGNAVAVQLGPCAEAYGSVQRKSKLPAMEVVDRFSASPAPRGGSIASTSAGVSLFSPPQAAQQIFSSPYTSNYVPMETVQPNTNNPFSAASEALRGVEGITEIAQAAGALKEGLRHIAAPRLPPRVLQLVRNGRQSLQKHIHIRGQRLGRRATETEHPATPKKPNRVKAMESDSALVMSSSNLSAIQRSKLISSALSAAAPTEELIVSLQQLLEVATVPLDQQEDAANMLEHLSRQLDPGCAILLPVLALSVKPVALAAECCRPNHLAKESKQLMNLLNAMREGQSNDSPEPLAVTRDSELRPKRSALYYDPFETMRSKVRKNEEVLQSFWDVGTTGTVNVELKNPMGATLNIDSIKLILQGCQHIAYPREEIEIPPYTMSHTVSLSAAGLECGTMQVVGVMFSINNAVFVANFDDLGKVIPSRQEMGSIWSYPRSVPNTKEPRQATNAKAVVTSIVGTVIVVIPSSSSLGLRPLWRTASIASSSTAIARVEAAQSPRLDDERVSHVLIAEGEKRRLPFGLIATCDGSRRVGDIRLTVTQTVRPRNMSSDDVKRNGGKSVCVQSRVLRNFTSVLAPPKLPSDDSKLGPSSGKSRNFCSDIPFVVNLSPAECFCDTFLPCDAARFSDVQFVLEIAHYPGLSEVLIELEVVDWGQLDVDSISLCDAHTVSVFSRKSSLKICIEERAVIRVGDVQTLALDEIQSHGHQRLSDLQIRWLQSACTAAQEDGDVRRPQDNRALPQLCVAASISHIVIEVTNASDDSVSIGTASMLRRQKSEATDGRSHYESSIKLDGSEEDLLFTISAHVKQNLVIHISDSDLLSVDSLGDLLLQLRWQSHEVPCDQGYSSQLQETPRGGPLWSTDHVQRILKELCLRRCGLPAPSRGLLTPPFAIQVEVTSSTSSNSSTRHLARSLCFVNIRIDCRSTVRGPCDVLTAVVDAGTLGRSEHADGRSVNSSRQNGGDSLDHRTDEESRNEPQASVLSGLAGLSSAGVLISGRSLVRNKSPVGGVLENSLKVYFLQSNVYYVLVAVRESESCHWWTASEVPSVVATLA